MKRVARVAAIWIVGLAACNGRKPAVRRPVVAPAAPLAEVAVAPLAAPHGGRIDLVAITDRGDAALTSDVLSELRLWPTLDGTHEPVVVRGPRATQLALGRDGGRLCAAILDEAGGVELLRFDGNGGLLGRAQLAFAPSSIEQVVAVPGGVLVRRADHSIERFDVRGAATGRLVVDAGQRVVSLAVRRGRAIAGITSGPGMRATSARWIGLGSTLAWGAVVELPVRLSDLALAPGGARLAGIGSARNLDEDRGVIVELAPRPVVVGEIELLSRAERFSRAGRSRRLEPPIIGFTDDHTVASGVAGILTFASATGATPWTARRPEVYDREGQVGIGDRVAAAASATLQLSSRDVVQYLGYRFLGEAQPSTHEGFREGGGLLLEVEGGRLWLDRMLRARPPTLDPELNSLALVLDDRHLLFMPQAYRRAGLVPHRIVVRDLATGTDTEVAELADVSDVRYDPGTHVLAFAAGDDVLRYRLSFAPVAVTPLRTLAEAGLLRAIYLTDPALANGVVAVVDSTITTRALVYRITGDDSGPPVMPDSFALAGPVAAVDRAGAIYVAASGTKVYRAGHRTAQPLPGVSGIMAVSHDGRSLAVRNNADVTVFDASGALRWRRPVWKAGPVAWSVDDRTLFMAAEGGAAISFDVATGEQLAMRCGWGFGLHDHNVSTPANLPSACAVP